MRRPSDLDPTATRAGVPVAPAPAGPAGHLPGSRDFRRLNLAMGAAGLAAFGMLYATQPLLPEIGADFGVDATRASLTISVTTGLLALLVIPATRIGAQRGRVATMRLGLLVAAVLTLLSAVAPTYPLLLVARGLTGAALALVVGVAMGHVAAEVHPRGLATAMGLYVAGNSLGGVGGRVVTSAVVDLAGSWRWAVVALGVCALLATLAFLRLVPGPAAGVASAIGVPPPPGRVVDLLRDPAVLAVLALPFLLMGGFVATYNYLTYRLTGPGFELPAAVVGLVFLAYLAGTAASAVAGRAADRVGRAVVLVVSVAVMGAGLLLTLPDVLWLVVVGLVVLTSGFFGAHSVASGWAPVVGSAQPARTSALYVASYYVGSSVFGALVGLGWRAGGWPLTVACVGALVGLAGVATAVLLARTGRSSRRSAAC